MAATILSFKDISLAIFVVFVWGSYFIAEKMALNFFPVVLLSGIRYLIVFLLTGPFLFKEQIPLKEILCLAIINILNILALNIAINLSSNLAPIILIQQFAVPITILLGIFFFKEKFYAKNFVGLMISFLGLIIILHLQNNEYIPFKAIILALLNAFLFALYNLFIKRLSGYNFLTILAYLSLTGFPCLLLISYFYEIWPDIRDVSKSSVWCLLYITVISGILCLFIWIKLLKKYPISKISPFLLLVPVFGCLTSSIIGQEQLTFDVIFGGGLIMLGLVLIEKQKRERIHDK
jgi:O-acetylserine/cysteine efflux transporter